MGSGGGLAGPVLHKYTTGSGTEVVPNGSSTVTIEVWGGGGGGGAGGAGCTGANGDGGGSGAYTTITLAVVPGQTLNYSVGLGGAKGSFPNGFGFPGTDSTVTSGTMTITTLTAPHGLGTSNGSPGAGGAIGTGGSTNLPGNAGTLGTATGAGGAAVSGIYDSAGGGGNGGTAGVGVSGTPGNPGECLFRYS